MTLTSAYSWKRLLVCEKGSEVAELSLVLIPLFTFVFAVASVAWLIFAQACIQNGVREAVRFAVTHQSDADIKTMLQKYAFGFASDAAIDNFSVRYYKPGNLQPAAGNSAGNMVEVSVQVHCAVLIPLGTVSPRVELSAASSDVMEGM